MQLAGDRRGQSIQIGAIILFGAIIILLSTYQAFVVPNQNRDVEFKHSQTVQNDMKELRSSLISAADGRQSSVSVQLGTEYPSRAIFVNPGPPSGTLRTVGTNDPEFNITIDNGQATGDAGSFWDGTERNYSTGDIVYKPNYNVYQTPPTTVYSNTVLANEFGGQNLTIGDQSVVDGRTINLVAVSGSLSRGQASAATVDVRTLSATRRNVALNNTGGPLTVNFTTSLANSTWEDQLQHEVDNGHVQELDFRRLNDDFNVVSIRLESDETYRVNLARVGVGSRVGDSPDAAYLVKTRGDGTVVPSGERVTLEVEARDEYNNPVSGEVVEASAVDGDIITASSETDGDGTVEFVYEAPNGGGGDNVKVSLENGSTDASLSDFDSSTPENVTFNLTVSNSSSDGGAYSVDWKNPSGEAGTEECDSNECTFNYTAADTLELTMLTDPVADGASVDYAVGNQDIGSVAPRDGFTDSSGENTTTFTPCNNGEVNVYTSSGGDGDVIELNVTNYGNLTVDPDTAGANSTHKWRFDDICYDGEVDTITADYPAGASFDGLDQDDITVQITREGETSPTVIDVNDADYSGSTATFDLDGAFDTDIDGLVVVEIDGLENPPEGDWSAELTFDGDDTAAFEKDFTTILPGPRGTVDVEDGISPSQTDFVVNYTFDFTTNDNATLVVENEDTGGSTRQTVDTDGQATIQASDVNGLNSGDTVRATLYEFDNETNELDTDAVTVEPTAADQVSLNTASVETVPGANTKIQFNLSNAGGSAVDVTAISVDSTDTSATYVEDETDNIEFEGAGGSLDQRIDIGGATESMDTDATINGGATETFELGQFRDGAGNGGRVNMQNQQAVITLTFGDGSTKELTLNT